MSTTIDLSKLSIADLQAELAERTASEKAKANDRRKSYEELKEKSIMDVCLDAKVLHNTIKIYKQSVFETMETLYQMLQEYSKRHADGKGNFTLENEHFRICYSRQEKGFFDERSEQAEKHITEFITERFEDDTDSKDLIMSLLERKKGHLDIKLVQKLYAMEDRFESENWKEGIKLLKESWKHSDSKDYITMYEKDANNEWHQINLNFSSI